MSAPNLPYLKLLRQALCRDRQPDARFGLSPAKTLEQQPFDAALREEGKDWPTEALTMVGAKRLENLQACCLRAVEEKIPGDLVETGVWRGGCGILMRAVLAAANDESRKVWMFDSFAGLPKPDAENFPPDKDDTLWTYNSYLAVSMEMVQANFARFDLLDGRTQFVPGWFRDTIPLAALDSIAVLRLDGDLYESTWLVLTNFYEKLSPGGFVIVDDYALDTCKAAVDDFRNQHSIETPPTRIDWTGVFWRK